MSSRIAKTYSLLKAFKFFVKNFKMQKPVKAPAINAVFIAPSEVKGMVNLNREAFTKQVTLPALYIPQSSLAAFNKTFKTQILKTRGAKFPHQSNSDGEEMGMYRALKQDFDFTNLTQKQKEALETLRIKPVIERKTLCITYEHYKHREILNAILPEGLDVTSGFERVGHIIHVNLREHQIPYKNIIGQVLLDKHVGLKTVVNKTSIIDSTYRNFEMEVIAGEEEFVTKVVEYGFTFHFDFSKVFWNSKLHTEHHEISCDIPKLSHVFDVFAGVGPFAIPLARKGCHVHANDLNTHSYKWLLHNSKVNKAQLTAYNLDGRQFIKDTLGKHLRSMEEKTGPSYVIMNLPALSIEFLDAFKGLLNNTEEAATDQSPEVHVFCYTFSSAEDAVADIQERVKKHMRESLPENHKITEIRKVSTGKFMYRISFVVPTNVFTTYVEEIEQPKAKKAKTEDLLI